MNVNNRYNAIIKEGTFENQPIYRVWLKGFGSEAEASDFIAKGLYKGSFIVREQYANRTTYFTGTDTAAQTDLTSVGRDIIGKNTIAEILTYLGLGEYRLHVEATDYESAALDEWSMYRVLLMRVDSSKAPAIEWPTQPAQVASGWVS